jgi:hypothetical protein
VIGMPIILSSSYTLSGAALVPNNPAGLYCPYQRAMLVEEFRLGFNDVGPHKISLKAGRSLITEGALPWNAIFPILESEVYGLAMDAVRIGASNWKLSRPLYLPIQRQVAVTLQKNMTTSNLARALFGIRGRVLPEDYRPPETVAVPWVGLFRPASTDLDSADTTLPYKSVGEFKNQFKETLHITKMIGASTSESTYSNNDTECGTATEGPNQSGAGRSVPLIRIFDGKGNPIVRDATKLLHLCQGIRNEWNIEFDMAPGELLQATMDLRHADINDFALVVWPSIAMVGWREVPYAEIYG